MDLNEILNQNEEWAAQSESKQPEVSTGTGEDQPPDILWIGCSDNPVSPAELTGLSPGKLLVHRNIANLALGADTNYLSALEYAVNGLNVRHIVICGHTNCGGIKAVTDDSALDYVKDWTQEIHLTKRANADELDAINDPDERRNRLSKLNVIQQVDNIAGTRILREAWDDGRTINIHGLMFDLDSGRLNDVLRDVTEPQ